MEQRQVKEEHPMSRARSQHIHPLHTHTHTHTLINGVLLVDRGSRLFRTCLTLSGSCVRERAASHTRGGSRHPNLRNFFLKKKQEHMGGGKFLVARDRLDWPPHLSSTAGMSVWQSENHRVNSLL